MDIQNVLAQFISEELLSGRVTVGADDDLLRDDLVDSLGMLRLVGFIEERYGMQVPPADFTIENFRTVGVLSAYLQRSLGA